MSQKRTPALIFIFITMLIDVIGIGLIIPILPDLIKGYVGGTEAQASVYGAWLMTTYAAMQFFFSPIIGGLSDQYGRRPVILASLFGFGIDYILLGFAPNLAWLFVGRFIAGIAGASFTTAGAYIADISKPEDRAKNFGLIGAAFGIGFILGPVIGGALGEINLKLPFFASAGLTLLNWLYGFFVLPESLAVENRRKFDWKRANPFSSLKRLTKYKMLMGLAIAFFFLTLAGQVNPSTWSYYTKFVFHWSKAEVGYSLGFVGLMVAIVQGGLARIIIPKLGEKRSILTGFVFFSTCFFLYGFATQGWMMYAIMVPFAMGGIAGPSLQSLMTQQVSPSEQGELQGSLTSLTSLTSIFGPIIASTLFEYFSTDKSPFYFPGAAFVSAGLLTAIGLCIAVLSFPKNEKVAE